jgi:hypothetical protein
VQQSLIGRATIGAVLSSNKLISYQGQRIGLSNSQVVVKAIAKVVG